MKARGRLVGRATYLAAAGALLLALVAVTPRYLRAAALVVDASAIEGWPHRVAAWHAAGFRIEDESVSSRHGRLRGRLYRPAGEIRSALLLAPGVHPGGLDEPRLVRFAGQLASRHVAVLTVELPDLLRYQITPRTTDMIEDAAAGLGSRMLSREGRVGLAGISFAGGLCVSAAGRPALRDRVSFVLSLGGHGNLGRTLRYYCTGVLADGSRRPPHDYAVAITLLAMADRVVPPSQVDVLRTGILTFLDASSVDSTDHGCAAPLFNRARALERQMPEPSVTLMRAVNTRDVGALGSTVLPYAASFADEPALSPELSTPPAAPVYLLHGADDNVIPALESRLLAAHLAGQTRVELLITPVLRHADVDRRPGLLDAARMVRFWASALEE